MLDASTDKADLLGTHQKLLADLLNLTTGIRQDNKMVMGNFAPTVTINIVNFIFDQTVALKLKERIT